MIVRCPELDVPALQYETGGKTHEFYQLVGFSDNGSKFTIPLETAIQEGLLKKGEVRRQVRRLNEYADEHMKEFVRKLREEAKRK